jgi:hypothetical protein
MLKLVLISASSQVNGTRVHVVFEKHVNQFIDTVIRDFSVRSEMLVHDLEEHGNIVGYRFANQRDHPQRALRANPGFVDFFGIEFFPEPPSQSFSEGKLIIDMLIMRGFTSQHLPVLWFDGDPIKLTVSDGKVFVAHENQAGAGGWLWNRELRMEDEPTFPIW